mgnify:CR=1 FL=1
MIEDYPANIAAMLLNDTIDVGLVPVAILPRLNEYHFVSDYCIGADGPVASVCLFSEKPLHEIKTVLLDYQSRTSAALTRVLLKNYWKLDPVLEDTRGDEFLHRIQGDTAGLVIGDRALKQGSRSAYKYDLAEAWKAHTGLSFVFAAWVSNKPLPEDFIRAFNEANASGLDHLGEIIRDNPFPAYDLEKYYSENLSYLLDEKKKAGIKEFLHQMKAL